MKIYCRNAEWCSIHNGISTSKKSKSKLSQGQLLWWELISEHFNSTLRIKRSDLSTKPRLLSLILSLLQAKTGFHISALEQRVAQQLKWHKTVSGGGSAPTLGAVSTYVASPSWKGNGKVLQKTTGSGKVSPSPKTSCNILHRIYCRKLQHFCSPSNWVC